MPLPPVKHTKPPQSPPTTQNSCGHATLASAHALWATGRVPPRASIAFETKSGRLLASRQAPAAAAAQGGGEGEGDWIWLDFPAEPASPMTKGPENDDWQLVFDAFMCEDEKDIVYIGACVCVGLGFSMMKRIGEALE
jgi:hypothetical protein